MLEPAVFGRLQALDTCAASNAIERFDVRPRNEGFVHGTVRCLFPALPPMLGYAVTGRIRSSTQPVSRECYYDSIGWWASFESVPGPRVMVLQDVDDVLGLGAFVGEIHATIATALNCVGCVTNGAVRDLARIEEMGFPLFAGSVSPSHAYAHVVDWGQPVKIGGLSIQPGDLIHGDRHGVQSIPLSVAAEVARVADTLDLQEAELIDLCRSPRFSIQSLSEMFERMRVTRSTTGVPPSPDK
jgi:regulator of RNase E activity RraA